MILPGSKYWISFLLVIASVSCEEDVKNVRLPEYNQKLVINSFISPLDTVSYINITSNRRIYGELKLVETLGNLTAFISDNSSEISLETAKSGFIFRPEDMVIGEGKTYKLRVISDKGLTAEATCTVPFFRNLKLEADTFRTVINHPYSGVYSLFKMNISFTDFPGEKNYYRLYCEQEIYKFTNHPVNYGTRYFDFDNSLFSDNGKDGEKTLITSLNIYDPKFADSSFFRIYILNTDKAYYNYHISLKNYSGGEDPFTEVSPIYSNVTGGLGIFAAYTVDSLIIRLK